jgi:threonine synthase
MVAMQRELAETEGIYAEVSSVISLCVAKKLVDEGRIQEDNQVVAFLTSGGLKDPETTSKYLPSIPLIEPNLDAMRSALASTYRFSL